MGHFLGTQRILSFFIRSLWLYIWLYMIIYDYIWLYMIIYDYIWLYMIIYDYIWLYIFIYVYMWLWQTPWGVCFSSFFHGTISFSARSKMSNSPRTRSGDIMTSCDARFGLSESWILKRGPSMILGPKNMGKHRENVWNMSGEDLNMWKVKYGYSI